MLGVKKSKMPKPIATMAWANFWSAYFLEAAAFEGAAFGVGAAFTTVGFSGFLELVFFDFSTFFAFLSTRPESFLAVFLMAFSIFLLASGLNSFTTSAIFAATLAVKSCFNFLFPTCLDLRVQSKQDKLLF